MLSKMKNIFIYGIIIFITGIALFNGCDSPAPTQLVQDNSTDQNPVQVEVIAKDTGDAYYTNGFDTSGVAGSLTGYTNFINVSGTKVTRNSITINSSFAQAIFFDKSSPVHEQGGKLIGYHTMTPGVIRFNNIRAGMIPYHVVFNSRGIRIDSILGLQYALSSGPGKVLSQFNFEYNSSVNFQYIPMHGAPVSFDIQTPQEIIGQVRLAGRRANGNLSATLLWNKSNQKQIEVILGVIPKGQLLAIPLYKMEVSDNGRLIIPAKLLNSIPPGKYDKIVFTFVRKYDKQITEKGNDLYVLSQSIHSIIIDIP